jgi:hypothetical protein
VCCFFSELLFKTEDGGGIFSEMLIHSAVLGPLMDSSANKSHRILSSLEFSVVCRPSSKVNHLSVGQEIPPINVCTELQNTLCVNVGYGEGRDETTEMTSPSEYPEMLHGF